MAPLLSIILIGLIGIAVIICLGNYNRPKWL